MSAEEKKKRLEKMRKNLALPSFVTKHFEKSEKKAEPAKQEVKKQS